jgi:hypothetical protein
MQNSEKLKSLLSDSFNPSINNLETNSQTELDKLISVNRELEALKQMLDEISSSFAHSDLSSLSNHVEKSHIPKPVPSFDKEILNKTNIEEGNKSVRSHNESEPSAKEKSLKSHKTVGILNNYLTNANKLNRNTLKSTDKKEKSITKDKSTSKLSSHRATMKDRDEDSFQHKSKKI